MRTVKLGSMPIGSIVQLHLNGSMRDFLVVHQGKPSQIYDDSCIGTWLLTKDIFEERAWTFRNYNDYETSEICKYLSQGFISMFNEAIRPIIKQVKIPYRPGAGIDTIVKDGANGLSCKAFLLSGYEIGWTNADVSYIAADGSKLDYFISGSTESAIAKRIAYLNGVAKQWWLRSPYIDHSSQDTKSLLVMETGACNNTGCLGVKGIRPVIILPSEMYYTDDGTFTENSPPTQPPSITVPENIRINKSVTVTWGAATDPDGDAVSYELERSVDAAAYGNAYSGAARTHTETAGANWTTVQYRVRTKDANGAYSDYTIGDIRPVIHNVDPTISGQDTDLGNVTAPPSYTYQIDDADPADTLTVTEQLDGRTLHSIANAARNTPYTMALSIEQYITLQPGQHRMTITVVDSGGNSVTRNITFTRVVETIDFELRPRQTDALAEKILVSMRYIGDPADLRLEVCNNAFDSAPAWEDAAPGQKHLFTNTTCASGKPGIGVRIRLEPSHDFPEVACFAPNVAYL